MTGLANHRQDGLRSDDPLALQSQVCFALAVANRSVLAVYRPLLEPMGLTHPQYLVMLALWERDGALSVRELAGILQLDPATVSPLLKRLEAADYLTRARSAGDERQLEITLTPSGRRLRRRAERIPAAVMARLGVDFADLHNLHRVLTDINTAALAAAADR
ncbi:MarR family transcriptional regulator [Jatrophihabitans telluris]|uniref:MarR family transcriptional regulator n=1 Tax=Jatrophihabitans telluris TaxID=2038343 RepID=A0ABY4QZX0_9ACTN|nr:MarR family transcriptional regulator [Jatrophihabitans telluris]UQX88374.1 MarR family transcriptional regulator [Jatrophihabitans telluris]